MAQPDRRPATHRTPDGRRMVAPTWESLVERQLREAMEAGEFDDLPHQGRPLPKDDDAYAGEWAMAFRMLRNAGAAPPWIEADKEVRRLLAQRDALVARVAASPTSRPTPSRSDRTSLERLVHQVNAAIARLNAEAPTDRQHRRPLDLAAELDRLDAAASR